MFFLTLSDANVQFGEKLLEQRSYITTEVLSITKRVELINNKEFAATALNKNAKTFVVYVITFLAAPIMQVHLLYQVQVDLLLIDKALVKVPLKHLDYIDIFLFDLAIKLLKNTGINKHTIELVKGKQPPHRLINNL